MGLKTWAGLFVLLIGVGISGCSTNTHTVKNDSADDDILFPTKSKSKSTSKVAATKNAKIPVAGANKKQATPYSRANTRYQPSIPIPQPVIASGFAVNRSPTLSPAELRVIGERIFQNEGGGSVDHLVHWNDGEDFASMGIGHFTWYPRGRAARYGNTFPELLNYMQVNGVQLPVWLRQARYSGAPWNSKAELMYAKNTGQVRELQNLLYQTRLLQAAYIVERARRAMPQVVNAAGPQERAQVARNLNAVANTPGGWYVLIDYVNFKGEGLNRFGGYNGQNWGLLQVLEEMRPVQPGQQALHEFANAATRVLTRRVKNAPPARNERRWLAGWSNRINTYRYPGV